MCEGEIGRDRWRLYVCVGERERERDRARECTINIQCLSACLGVLAEVREIDSSSLGDCRWKATTRLWAPAALESSPQASISAKPIFTCTDKTNTKCHCSPWTVCLPVGLFAFLKLELFSCDITAGCAGVIMSNVCPYLPINLRVNPQRQCRERHDMIMI